MVLQVGANLGRVDLHGDAVALQFVRRAHARQLQQLRALQSARRQNHFAVGARLSALAVFDPFHADGAAGFDQHLCHLHPSQHAQVAAPAHGRQEGDGRIAAPVAAQGQLVGAQAFVLRAVEVGAARKAGFLAGGKPGGAVGVVVAQIGHIQLALAAVVVARATGVALGFLEEGQHLAVAPAVGTSARPVVVVGLLAADVDQPVDGAGAAQHAAARPDHAAVAGFGLGLDLELPGKARVVDGAEVAHRQAQPEVAAPATRLQQQHPAAARAQAVGQHTAGRTGAHDDVIEAVLGGGHALTRLVNKPGSKYCLAGTAFWMLAFCTKKSVTCCSQWVTVPSAYLARHSAEE